MKNSIMVTGVGAVIGQGIIKSLKGKTTAYRLIGIDANSFSVGFKWTDSRYTVPLVSDFRWTDSIIDICNKENVVLILPGIEQDVRAFVQNFEKVTKSTHALPLLNSSLALKVGLDKWELYLFAQEVNVKMPLTLFMNEVNINSLPRFNYPMLLKPRKGMASKGIYRIENDDDLLFWTRRLPQDGYIVQQYVGSDDEEYTVSVFGFKNGSISEPFALKRKLNYGSTFEAETVYDPNLNDIVSSLAKKLHVVGPTNFQFRKVENDYYLLEINPRFSSSTSIKSAFGFNEPLMAIKSFIEDRSEIRLKLKTGRCSRYLSDSIIFE